MLFKISVTAFFAAVALATERKDSPATAHAPLSPLQGFFYPNTTTTTTYTAVGNHSASAALKTSIAHVTVTVTPHITRTITIHASHGKSGSLETGLAAPGSPTSLSDQSSFTGDAKTTTSGAAAAAAAAAVSSPDPGAAPPTVDASVAVAATPAGSDNANPMTSDGPADHATHPHNPSTPTVTYYTTSTERITTTVYPKQSTAGTNALETVRVVGLCTSGNIEAACVKATGVESDKSHSVSRSTTTIYKTRTIVVTITTTRSRAHAAEITETPVLVQACPEANGGESACIPLEASPSPAIVPIPANAMTDNTSATANFYQGGGNEASYAPSSNVVKPTYTTPAPVYTPAASAPIPTQTVTALSYGISHVSPSLASYVPHTDGAPKYPSVNMHPTGTGSYPKSFATASASGTGPLRYPGQNVTVTLPAAPATTIVEGGLTTVTAQPTAGAGRLEIGLGALAVAGLALFL